MTSSQHNATSFSNPAQSSPDQTENRHLGYVARVRQLFRRSAKSSVAQYQLRTNTKAKAAPADPEAKSKAAASRTKPEASASIAEVKAWVVDDRDRAAEWLEFEQTFGKQRVSLIAWLEDVIAAAQ